MSDPHSRLSGLGVGGEGEDSKRGEYTLYRYRIMCVCNANDASYTRPALIEEDSGLCGC